MKLKLLLLAFLLFVTLGWGQTTLANYKFENNLTVEAGSIGSPNLTFSIAPTYNAGVIGVALSTGTGANANGAFLEVTIATTGYTGVTVSWAGRTSNAATPGSWVLTGDSGSGYGATILSQSLTTTFVNTGDISLGASFDNNASIKIKIAANNSSFRNLRIDDLIIKGTLASPTITLSPTTLSGFNYVVGSGPSAEQTFTASGSNLVNNSTGDITITPPIDYEISTTSGAGFGSSITLTQSGGVVNNTTIYVRLKAGLAVNTYNGEAITASSASATNKIVTCSGSVTNPVPVITLAPTALAGFAYILGTGPSAEQPFMASGINLTSNITLTAPANYEISTVSGAGFGSSVSLTQVAGTVTATIIYVRLKAGLASGNYNLENVTASATGAISKTVACSGTVTTPTITLTPTALTGFTYVFGSGPSTEQTFTASGVNLSSDILLTPPTDYEISTTSGAGFGSSITLMQSGGVVNNTTIYVRLKAGLAVATYNSETITATATNAVSKTVTCSGNVVAPPPVNDLCASATGLTVNAVATSGNMTGSIFVAPFTEKDVWYTFTPVCTGTHTITVTGFTGDIDIELFLGSCPASTTFLYNSDGSTVTETITQTLTSGVTYYLRVLAFNPAASTSTFTARVVSVGSLTLTNAGSPTAGNISANTNNVVLFGFDVTPNSCVSSYDFTSVTITKTLTATASDLSNFRIFYDADGNGAINGGESSVSGTGIALAASMNFTISGQTSLIAARKYLLVADVAVLATGGNQFRASISPATNLTAIITPTGTVTGTATGNIQTIIYSGPEINVTKTTTISSIPTGSTPSVGFDTVFATTNLGSSSTAKTYRIYNLGSTTLNVSSVVSSNPTEFVVNSAAPFAIAPGLFVTFTLTFSPANVGTRTSTISIVNNDVTNDGALTENPYTFGVQGDGACGTVSNTITPAYGPVGTEVTITSTNGALNNLTGATATFNGITATVVLTSATQMVVIVPVGASSGNLTTTNSQGCAASNSFNIIKTTLAGCEGGNPVGELFISEITDETLGSMTYVEIYNGTGAAVNLAAGNYRIKVYNNGGGGSTCDIALTGTIANNDVYVLRIGGNISEGVAGNAGGVIPDQIEDGCSAVNDNDNIRLFKGAVHIDQWGFPTNTTLTGIGGKGYTFRRLNTAAPLPRTTFVESDWNVIDANDVAGFDSAVDYTNIGLYDFSTATPPSVILQPSYIPSCKETSFTVAGIEGFPAGNALAYQWFVAAPGAATWMVLSDGGVYSGTSTATLIVSNNSGLNNYQYYCQIRENSATCYSASNTVKITETQTTWNGIAWSNGNPTSGALAIINGNYNTAINGDFECCSLLIDATFTLDIKDGDYVSIQNDLTVNGTLEVQNQGSLVMISDSGIVTNNGITNVRKMSTPFDRYDYTFWSSPIVNAPISVFSQWQTNYIFKLNTATFRDDNNDAHDDNGDAWVFTPQAQVMSPGRGYAAMGKINQTYPAQQGSVYSGAVNNGVITQPIALSLDNAKVNDDFNLVGNPYPSAISADAFITGNPDISGTLYFWTHEGNIQVAAINPGPNARNFSADDFAYYNLSGGTGTRAGLLSGNGNSNAPSGFIASGQGFQVDADAATSVMFNNGMRNKTYANTNFYRTNTVPVEKDRIWLNLTNPEGIYCQQLIGFFPQATMAVDRGYDGYYTKSATYAAFYSMIADKPYKIQGRSAFDVNDRVPLGFRSAYQKTYTISIGDIEGVLRNQNVYIEDLELNIIHDLRVSNYVFSTPAGEFNNRFVLRFTNTTLGNEDFEATADSVLIYTDQSINVTSVSERIKEVAVYDVLGRRIAERKNIDANTVSLANVRKTQSTLIVKVTLDNGQTLDRKIVY
ncbi:hypothetical protein FLJC2902T_10470 [Flavobacterium limnosediminis JC2902]|uniref:LTD domain-containing protein n=1 Tax=Flavobacterium limnosediminis JC2902 TaxID=1341181 RepID=V6SQP2_9FLAO|nr:T9SS sorting signal type C domain-containing protein [Flavobacterium limnosediminis]ESU29013.1 hypothetical protein FLJC2902T_10470 [Flavobacterium limnosediminis JC2902]